MAKGHGLGMGFDVDGIDLSGDVNAIGKLSGGLGGTQDMTGIDKYAPERQGLLRTGEVSLTSFFNPTSAHPKWSTLPTVDVVAGIRFDQLIGGAGCGLVAKQTDYKPSRQKDGSLLCEVNLTCNGFGLEYGVQLTAGKRSDTGATAGAAVDYGAAVGTTNFGLQMYVQLYSFTGTSITIKVQSSTDNAGDAYADVTGATTAALTAPTAVRIATGVTAAVERYLKVTTVGTFSQATFAVLACRNLTAPAF